MQLTKRIRDKSSNGNQDNTTSDGGDSLPTTASSAGGPAVGSSIHSTPTILPRKSIRDYGDSSSAATKKVYEDSYLLYKGRKSYLMISISKAITWLAKLSIHYHHKHYLTNRLIIYFVIILIAGLVKDFLLTSPPSPLPNSVIDWINTNLRTSKRNFLNVYFVKWGWLWTFISLIPFFIFTRFYVVKRSNERDQRICQATNTPKRKKSVHFREPLEDHAEGNISAIDQSKGDISINDQPEKKSSEQRDSDEEEPTKKSSLTQFSIQFTRELFPTIVRLAISTVIWYYSVNFFVYYANLKGECRDSNSTLIESVVDKLDCEKKHQGKWHLGFDISGHIFLMVYSNLIRIEELFFLLKKFEEFSEFRYLRLTRTRSMNYATPYRFSFSPFHLFALLVLTVSMVVTLVWDFMIIQTSFFYHTWEQKVAGFVWAVLAWSVTYQAAFTLPQLRLQVTPHL